jgi:two-component system KDP operon response regulator KdpE
MSEKPTVILIEDDAAIRRFVRTALEDLGCTVFEASTARQGTIELATRRPDLLILDLGLPDNDGIEVIRDFRGWSNIPIVVLSARAAELDKVNALDAGADDYLIKPFGVDELLARVRVQLRRKSREGHDATPVICFDDVKIDRSVRTVERAGIAVHLTPIEYRLLTIMLANVGKVLTHRALLTQVWGPNSTEQNHYLRIYVGRLRQKLERDPTRPEHFITETGVGYRFLLQPVGI